MQLSWLAGVTIYRFGNNLIDVVEAVPLLCKLETTNIEWCDLVQGLVSRGVGYEMIGQCRHTLKELGTRVTKRPFSHFQDTVSWNLQPVERCLCVFTAQTFNENICGLVGSPQRPTVLVEDKSSDHDSHPDMPTVED